MNTPERSWPRVVACDSEGIVIECKECPPYFIHDMKAEMRERHPGANVVVEQLPGWAGKL